MQDFIITNIEFEDNNLTLLCNDLKNCYNDNQKNFARICVTIYNIWSYCKNNYWKAKDDDYYNSYKLLAKFGFDKKAVSRYKQCFERYIQGYDVNNVSIKTYFKDFSPSKLYELLVIPYEKLEELIDKHIIYPEMTVKQIRDYIKSLKNGANEEINEEEIPEAYNPSKKYDFSYFETKTKTQLLNMIWELQKAYQKLKEKTK